MCFTKKGRKKTQLLFADDTVTTNTVWNPAEPKTGNFDCVQYERLSGLDPKWTTARCSDRGNFVCQISRFSIIVTNIKVYEYLVVHIIHIWTTANFMRQVEV